MNNCFLMLSHLKIHVILFMNIVVVMLLCSMLEINDDVLHCIALHCIALRCIAMHCIALIWLDLRSTGNLSSLYKFKKVT